MPERNAKLRECENHIAEAMIALREAKVEDRHWAVHSIQILLGRALDSVQFITVRIEAE